MDPYGRDVERGIGNNANGLDAKNQSREPPEKSLMSDIRKLGAETRTRNFSEATVKQVRMDCRRAMKRARFCPKRSEVQQIRCMDDHEETEAKFGSQLWYFEGQGVGEADRAHSLFGVVEYSLQYGLSELVEDGVYGSESRREKFRHLYEREVIRPSWEAPIHRWLAAALIAVTCIGLIFVLLTRLAA